MPTTAIKASDVSYQYPDGTPAIRQLSFTIQEGEKVAIIGPNGSGKSTLLTLLNGIRRGTGNLEIFDHLLSTDNARQVKKWVGLIFQNPDDQLFCPTIFEDVAFGPLNMGLSPELVKQRVTTALQNVGLEGYEKRSSFHLSFGERKLASIATVLAMNPRLMAMDEPTSNLDLAHRRRIIRWLQQNPQTTLVTSHDLDMVLETCRRVLILNRGRLVADGESGALLSDAKLMRENDLEIPLRIQLSR